MATDPIKLIRRYRVKYAQPQDGGQINAARPVLKLRLDALRGTGAASPPGPQSGADRSENGSAYESTQQPTTGGVSISGLIGGIGLGGAAARGGAALGKRWGEKITNLDELKKFNIPTPGPGKVQQVAAIIDHLDTITTRRISLLQDALKRLQVTGRAIEILDELATATVSVAADKNLLKGVTLEGEPVVSPSASSGIGQLQQGNALQIQATRGQKKIQVSVLSQQSKDAIQAAQSAYQDAGLSAAAADFLEEYAANAPFHRIADFDYNRGLLADVALWRGLPASYGVLKEIHRRAVARVQAAQVSTYIRQAVPSGRFVWPLDMGQKPGGIWAYGAVKNPRFHSPSVPTIMQDAYNMLMADAEVSFNTFNNQVQRSLDLVARDLERAKASQEQLAKARGFVTKSRAWTARAMEYGGAGILGALGMAAGYGLGSLMPEMIEEFGNK